MYSIVLIVCWFKTVEHVDLRRSDVVDVKLVLNFNFGSVCNFNTVCVDFRLFDLGWFQFSFFESLLLSALLFLDQQTLLLLLVCFNFLGGDFLLGFLLSSLISVLITVVSRLEPGDEIVDHRSKRFLNFAVIKCALFVGLDLVAVPSNHELIGENRHVIELLHESTDELLLAWVKFDEIQGNSLDEALNTNFSVSFNQTQKAGFKSRPCLDAVALALEEAAEKDVVLVFGGDVHDELRLSCFLEDIIAGRFTIR